MKRLDTAGIAQLLGYSRAYVTDRITKQPGFPKPIISLSRRHRFWSEVDVMQWVQKVSRAA